MINNIESKISTHCASGILGGLALFASPRLASAQEAVTSLQGLGAHLVDFINNTLVVLVFAVAFVAFIWGLVNNFILGGADPEKRAKGQQLMLWGIIAFFVMISVWGLVNILVGTISLDTTPHLPVAPSIN